MYHKNIKLKVKFYILGLFLQVDIATQTEVIHCLVSVVIKSLPCPSPLVATSLLPYVGAFGPFYYCTQMVMVGLFI